MTPLIPEVHNALMAVARRRAHVPPKRRISRRSGALTLVALAAGGSAMAATSWRLQLGDPERGRPTIAVDRTPADQVAALGALRRNQTDGDRGRRVRAALKLLAPSEDSGIHVDGVRLLAEGVNGALVLVPTERVGRGDAGYPSSIRREVLCVMQYSDAGGAGKSCGTAADLRAGRIAGSASAGTTTPLDAAAFSHAAREGVQSDGGQMRYFQLVPDGVTRVEVTLRDESVHMLDVRDKRRRAAAPGCGVRQQTSGHAGSTPPATRS